VPNNTDLPAAWWLFWLALGTLASLLLAAWFLRAGRRSDELAEEARRDHDGDDSKRIE
jgi:hypothetical protein